MCYDILYTNISNIWYNVFHSETWALKVLMRAVKKQMQLVTSDLEVRFYPYVSSPLVLRFILQFHFTSSP